MLLVQSKNHISQEGNKGVEGFETSKFELFWESTLP